jgi:NAD(P)-dependent dehydrogenase (short-subunit alcohol dehydrogenase family)
MKDTAAAGGPPAHPLDGKVAIVTGASSGIGRATAAALAAAGARVAGVGRDVARLQASLDAAAAAAAAAGVPGFEGLPLALDVGREEDMRAMADRTIDRFGRIDILVTSAGVLRAHRPGPRSILDTEVEEWRTVLGTNLRGLFLSNRAVLPAMMKQKTGDILNLSSTSGLRGFAYDGPYCASKFAALGFTESLAEEVRPFGIRVQALLPGPVATGIWSQNLPVPPPEKTIPVERVTDLVLHLLALPRDAMYLNPVVVPMRIHRRPAGRAAGPGGGGGAGSAADAGRGEEETP